MFSIDDVVLSSGAHNSRAEGTCFMEASAWLAGETHSDHPACVCPTLGEFLRSWNDSLSDADRQMLKPYVRLVIGTAGDGFEIRRSWMAFDWLTRECAPAFMDLTPGLRAHADRLRVLPEIRDVGSLDAAKPVLAAARAAAWDAARDAAWATAWDAARTAAGAAAWDAARAAAWDAARAAAGATARDAARTAAGAAARAAAWAAARAAAWATAWDAARTAAGAAAWAAAGDAATRTLRPVVLQLQKSALALLDRMLLLGLEDRRMPAIEIPHEPVLCTRFAQSAGARPGALTGESSGRRGITT